MKEELTNAFIGTTPCYYCDCHFPVEDNTSATHCGRCNKPILRVWT